MSNPNFISDGHSRFRYRIHGQGSRWLCLFHGYGEDGQKFDFLAPILGDEYRLLAIDMPEHGETAWHGPLLFKPAALMALIDQIIPAGAPIDLLGYSMGGRVCLRLLQDNPHRFGKLVLIAPDGLHKNPWQRLATNFTIGNQLFRWTMTHPGWLLGLINLAARLQLFNKSLHKFVHHYLDDPKQREMLYRRWTIMRQFRPRLKVLRTQLTSNPVEIHLLFGRYDRVIVAKHGDRFAQGLPCVTVQILEGGHHLLTAKYLPQILPLLTETTQ